MRIPLLTVPEHPCVYLPGRMARTRAFSTREFPGELYHDFMDAGFRRSGSIFYQPICRTCRACMMIRVPTDRFLMSKSQRRVWRHNTDLRVSIDVPAATDEKWELYRRYLESRHQRTGHDREDFESFLYDSPVQTMEACYRNPAGKLVGVGICDVCSRSLSTVYFYFDPAESRRSPGTFAALWEIEWARDRGIPHYYLGFWVKSCSAMEYKASFRPCELLGSDGVWRDFAEGQATQSVTTST